MMSDQMCGGCFNSACSSPAHPTGLSTWQVTEKYPHNEIPNYWTCTNNLWNFCAISEYLVQLVLFCGIF